MRLSSTCAADRWKRGWGRGTGGYSSPAGTHRSTPPTKAYIYATPPMAFTVASFDALEADDTVEGHWARFV